MRKIVITLEQNVIHSELVFGDGSHQEFVGRLQVKSTYVSPGQIDAFLRSVVAPRLYSLSGELERDAAAEANRGE